MSTTKLKPLQVYEDVQQPPSPSTTTIDQLSQSDPKWFIKPSHYHHLAELEIYPRIFLGSQWEAKDPDWFATHRISHVLNVSTLQNTFQKKPLYYPVLSSSQQQENILLDHDTDDPENVNPNIIKKNNKKESSGGAGVVKNSSTTTKITQIHINYYKINVDDSTDVNVRKYFEKVTDFLRDALEGSPTNNVLIHCKEGKSRSVTMMLMFGMAYFNLSLYEAFKHFENKTFNRSRINLGFQLQLMNYELEILQTNGESKPKNTLDFLNSAAVNSCRQTSVSNNSSPLVAETTPVEESSSKRSSRSKKQPLSDITNTKAANTKLAPPPTKPKRSTVKLLPPKKKNVVATPTIINTNQEQQIPIVTTTPSIPQISIKEETIPIISLSNSTAGTMSDSCSTIEVIQQQPVTPMRSPIRSARRSNHRTKTPSSIIKIPFSTLDNASYISPVKNKIPPTPGGTPSINHISTDILITDDYSALEFTFDEDDLEIAKGLEDRVFMTTPLKKRKTDEDVNMQQ